MYAPLSYLRPGIISFCFGLQPFNGRYPSLLLFHTFLGDGGMKFAKCIGINGLFMKKGFLFITILFLLTGSLFAQLRPLPAGVTDAFSSRYPHAQNVTWKDKLHYFEATFNLNGTEINADFSANGEWVSSETKTNYDNLPDVVKDGFTKSKYSDWTKGSVTEIQRMGKPGQYKIYVEKSSPFQKKYLYFDANGKLTRDVITL